MTRWQSVTMRVLMMLAGVIVLLVLALWLFDWNLLRHPLERRIGQAIGRTVTIDAFDVRLRWHPVLVVGGMRLGNASWSQQPQMAEIGHAEITLDLWSLLHSPRVIPLLRVERARLLLEKNANGMANWQFDTQKDKQDSDGMPMVIERAVIDDAEVRFISIPEKADMTIKASSVHNEANNPQLLKVSAEGNYLEVPASLQGRIGMLTSIEALNRAYPFQLSGEINHTRVSASGSVAKPLQFEGFDLDFELAGNSLGDLFPLLGVPLPPTPSYAVKGKLLQGGGVWNFSDFNGHIGSSDLRGQFLLNRALKPQFISADLISENVDMKDLSGLIGARAESGKKIVQPDKVLPRSPFSFDKLYAADANVKFRGSHLRTERLPVNDFNVVLKLKNGVLELDPLSLSLAQGTMNGSVKVDAGQSPINSSADIKFQRLHLEELIPGVDLKKASAGLIGGRVKLTGHGNSVADMLGSANGQVAFVMNGGSVSQLVVRLANLDVARSLLVLLGGDKSVPIRCMVADANAENGRMNFNTLLLDTQKALLDGEGSVNFADETLDLKLRAHPKDKSLVALKGPIVVSGTFKDPKAGPSLKNVAGRTALAAALGSLLGPLAFAPLLELGGGKDSDCGALISDVESRFGIKAPAQRPMSYRVAPTTGLAHASF